MVAASVDLVHLSGEFFQGLALGLRDEERREDTSQHEESEDFQKMVNPSVGATDILEETESDLRNNSTELAGSSADTVSSGTVTGREYFTRNDESGGVRTPVEENLGKGIKDNEGSLGLGKNGVVTETKNDEKDGQHSETHNLNGLTAHLFNGEDGDPVTGNGTKKGDDDVTDSVVEHGGVSIATTGETNVVKNDRVVKTKTVPSDIKSEPRISSTEKDLSVAPVTKVSAEIGPGSSGRNTFNASDSNVISVVTSSGTTFNESGSITGTLFDLLFNIHGITGGFGNGETVVKSNETRDGTNTDEDTPDIIQVGGVSTDLVLESSGGDKSNNTSGDLTQTLHSKDSGHHSTTTAGGGEFSSDNRRQRIITTNTNTKNDTPEGDDTPGRDSLTITSESLSDGSDNDDHQFNTIHALTTDAIGKPTEEKLTNNGTNGSRDLESSINIVTINKMLC